MPVSCWGRRSGTVVTRTTSCGLAAHRRGGSRSRPKCGRRTVMRAGPKKHGRSFFGYKNHVNADAKHKLIRHYAVTDAAVHDSQELDELLDTGNTCNDVFADSAYRSAKIEAKLRASGYNSRIHRRGRRNHPLSLTQMRVNHAKSRIRARIEHVFGAQQNAPGGRIVRTIGIVRARAKIGLQNLAYNIRRLVTLERLAAA